MKRVIPFLFILLGPAAQAAGPKEFREFAARTSSGRAPRVAFVHGNNPSVNEGIYNEADTEDGVVREKDLGRLIFSNHLFIPRGRWSRVRVGFWLK